MKEALFPMFLVVLLALIHPSTMALSDWATQNASYSSEATLTDYAASLDSVVVETVDIQSDGSCIITIETKIPTGDPLSALYKEVLNITHLDLGSGQPIPEDVHFSPLEPVLAGDVSHTGLQAGAPVRNVSDETFNSVSQEQLCCLGIEITSWGNNYVVESLGQLIIHLEADALLHITFSDDAWIAGIGPRNVAESNARASFVLTKVGIIQQMLEGCSFPTESSFNRTWETTFVLPESTALLNEGELFGKDWDVEFGSGNELHAEVYGVDLVPNRDEVVLSERMNVTMESINKTIWQILDEEDFLSYKIFNFKYSSLTGTGCLVPACLTRSEESRIGEDWNKQWSISLWKDNFTLQFTHEGIQIELDVHTNLTLSWYVGWDTEVSLSGVNVEWFKAWMSLHPDLDIDLNASIPTECDYEWSRELFSWSHTFAFQVGLVPVTADLNFVAGVNFQVNVSATASIECGIEAEGSLKAGVKWEDEFSVISEVDMDVNKTGPAIDVADVESWVKPSVTFSLEFMFYGVAGPYVDFTPYVSLHTWCTDDLHWWIKVGLDVTVGARFAGWIRDVVDLPSFERTIIDRVFWNISDSGNLVSDVAIADVRTPLKGWVGETALVFVDVLNVGYLKEDAQIDLTCWAGTSWEGVASQNISNIQEGASKTLNFTILAPNQMTNGSYTISANAQITTSGHDDVNSTNNWDSNATLLEVQNVAVTNMSTQREETYPGSGNYEVTVDVTAMNRGSVNVSALPIFVGYFKDGQSIPVSDVWCESMKMIFNMTPGQHKQKTFNWIQLEEEINTELEACVEILPHETNTLDNYLRPGKSGVLVFKTVVGQGYRVYINVTVQNLGNDLQDFTISLYANDSMIASANLPLETGQSETLIFSWNTTGFNKGSYEINAWVEPLVGWMTGHIVTVSTPGDVDGDHDVDIFDMVKMAGIYGAKLPDPRYQPNCDIDGDGDIDIFDIVIAAGHYGDSW